MAENSADQTPLAARRTVAAAVVLGAATLWTFWPSLSGVSGRWWGDPRYAHGLLVPAFALVVLWVRRGRLAGVELRPSAWGLPLVAAGVVLYLAGDYLYFDWLGAMALLPTLAGVGVAVGGLAVLRWAWPAVAFLGFMVPLPHRVEIGLGWPLRSLATTASTYLLQTCGMRALREGNIIHLGTYRLGVADACSGLSLLLLFFAFSTGLAMLIRRPLLDRLLIVASALPIALIANVARITVTGLLHQLSGDQAADAFFHDLAGWIMMPIALALLGIEVWLLDHLLVEPKPDGREHVASAAMAGLRRGPAQESTGTGRDSKARGPVFPFATPTPRR